MHTILRIEYLLKRALKAPVFKIFCYLGRHIGTLTNKRLKKDDISNILVFQGGGIGDLIRLFPLLKPLHEEFPHASINILSPFGRDFFNLYPYSDLIAEAIVIDVAKRHKSIFSKLRLVSQLRKKRFDLVICPQSGLGMIEFSIMSFLTGARYRLGFNKNGSGWLYTTKPELLEDRSIYSQNLELLRTAGINSFFDEDYFSVPEEDLAFARDLLLKHGAADKKVVFAISPFVLADTDNKSPQHNRSLSEPRTWPEQNYAELISQILQRYNAKVVLLGNRLPNGILSGLLATSRNPNLITAVGKTTIGQAAALLRLSSILISNDSGLLHVAFALKKPCIGIFGSTSPLQQYISGRANCTVLWKRIECSPCYVQEPIPVIECPHGIQCLRMISVNDVMEAIKAHISIADCN
jgi:heptosyltransferase-2